MEAQELGVEVRETVVHLLKQKGYEVRDISSGSGVPKLSRLEITMDGKLNTCAVKITTHHLGRISFTRKSDGTYKVLSDSDRVIYACPATADRTEVIVSMFNGETVKHAFDVNFDARKGTDQENLPMWLSPKQEPGQRFIGSGFQDKALWSEVVPLSSRESGSPTAALPSPTAECEPEPVGIMDRVKTMISEHMGVRPDQLEVDVRVKL